MKDKYSSHKRRALSALLPLALLIAGSTAQAAVIVAGDVQFDSSTSLYTYSYTVANLGSDFDIAILDIPIGSGVSVSNLVAPTGFGIIADGAPVNLVSFFEDTDSNTLATFAPETVNGTFSYQSTFGPGTVTFSALDVNGDTYTGTTTSAVPEPTASLLTLAATLPLLVSRRRTRL